VSYIDDQANGEQILARSRRSKIVFAKSVILGILAIAFIICFIGFHWFPKEDLAIRAILVFSPLLIAIILFIFDYLSYISMEIGVTTTRVLGHDGLAAQTVLNIPINIVTNVQVDMSMLGTMFNYGNIRVLTPAGEFSFETMADPMTIQQAIIDVQAKKL